MAERDKNAQKEWIKNLWVNCNRSDLKNESLWSRVSEMVYAFNGERQTRASNLIMKPDSLPVGVDCTLSPILPTSANIQTSRNEYCVLTTTSASTVCFPTTTATCPGSGNVNGSSNSISSTSSITSTDSPVKRLVCSPDLPVYSLISVARPDIKIEPTSASITTTKTTTTETIPNSQQQQQQQQHHQQQQQPQQQQQQPKVYRCTICSEGFNQKVSLTAHLKTHAKESEDPYQCNFCGKKFAVPARLTRHYRTHTGEKPYQCEYCNKSFSVKENLSVHKRIHTKERPYKCDVCDRAFEHSGKLHRHMRIHTGERPHKCNFCSKTFIQSGQLVIHLRTHTGEKPYVCKCCNKGFTCSKQLKVHTRTHTGEKPYACDICGKSFGYNHVLKLHQVAHYGEKVYKCTICQETFNSKKSMETHIKMAHSESNANRNGVDNESPSTYSTSDKENKMDPPLQTKYIQSAGGATASSVSVGEHNPSIASTMSTLKPISVTARLHSPSSSSSSSSSSSVLYDSYVQSRNGNTSHDNCTSSGGGASNTASSYGSSFYAPSLPPIHSQSGLNSALLAAAAAATEELAMNYRTTENGGGGGGSIVPSTYPSAAAAAKFQSPVHNVGSPSPSSYSDSSRSSLSPKLEIVEPPEETPSLYILPDDLHAYRGDPSPAGTTSVSPSVIMVPYADGLTPSSSSSTSPVPSPINIVDLASKDELSLPPRKRTKMILKSMEKEKMEDTNFRYNSVIHYAKAASQIA